MSKTIVFFGTDNFSLTVLNGLIEAGYNIAAVVTKPDSKSGRGQSINQPDVKKLAVQHNITVWQPQKISEINPDVAALGSDITGIVASYGKIIPESTINLFDPGIINVHPSLLPRYRGPTPIESAIAKGDNQTGVSIMQLTPEMDAGPIYGHLVHNLSGKETSPELYGTLANAGTAALISILPGILDGSIQASPQDNNSAIYCNLLDKKDAWIKSDELTATQAEQKIRAQLIFPKTKINILGNDIIITKAHVSSDKKTDLDIKCRDGLYLSIDELVAPSGKTMSAESFINGYC